MLNRKQSSIIKTLNQYGVNGVNVLSKATPFDTGKTACSWNYTVNSKDNSFEIAWSNSNRNDGALIVALIKYGHSTASGSWVKGNDFITPAMTNLLNDLVKKLNAEVKK